MAHLWRGGGGSRAGSASSSGRGSPLPHLIGARSTGLSPQPDSSGVDDFERRNISRWNEMVDVPIDFPTAATVGATSPRPPPARSQSHLGMRPASQMSSRYTFAETRGRGGALSARSGTLSRPGTALGQPQPDLAALNDDSAAQSLTHAMAMMGEHPPSVFQAAPIGPLASSAGLEGGKSRAGDGKEEMPEERWPYDGDKVKTKTGTEGSRGSRGSGGQAGGSSAGDGIMSDGTPGWCPPAEGSPVHVSSLTDSKGSGKPFQVYSDWKELRAHLEAAEVAIEKLREELRATRANDTRVSFERYQAACFASLQMKFRNNIMTRRLGSAERWRETAERQLEDYSELKVDYAVLKSDAKAFMDRAAAAEASERELKRKSDKLAADLEESRAFGAKASKELADTKVAYTAATKRHAAEKERDTVAKMKHLVDLARQHAAELKALNDDLELQRLWREIEAKQAADLDGEKKIRVQELEELLGLLKSREAEITKNLLIAKQNLILKQDALEQKNSMNASLSRENNGLQNKVAALMEQLQSVKNQLFAAKKEQEVMKVTIQAKHSDLTREPSEEEATAAAREKMKMQEQYEKIIMALQQAFHAKEEMFRNSLAPLLKQVRAIKKDNHAAKVQQVKLKRGIHAEVGQAATVLVDRIHDLEADNKSLAARNKKMMAHAVNLNNEAKAAKAELDRVKNSKQSEHDAFEASCAVNRIAASIIQRDKRGQHNLYSDRPDALKKPVNPPRYCNPRDGSNAQQEIDIL